MKQLIAGFSEYDAPYGGLGCFTGLFSSGIPVTDKKDLESVDALILWGGEDISPALYGQKRYYNSGPSTPSTRDVFEYNLIRQATEINIPIIGVCRGAQLLCVVSGGSLVQDVDGHQHQHAISTHDGETFMVNSYHHQMMYLGPTEHIILAQTVDKQSTRHNPPPPEEIFIEPEVVYFPKTKGLAIQYHPEWMPASHRSQEWLIHTIKTYCFKETV
jgi:gamma-glutamyl-gamma-aminobutyrate hydrolase PuuD